VRAEPWLNPANAVPLEQEVGLARQQQGRDFLPQRLPIGAPRLHVALLAQDLFGSYMALPFPWSAGQNFR
jgi:hypothetical protein